MLPVNYGIGIDLGTARTCTSIFRDDKAEIIPHEGNSFMPSCVAFSENGRLIGSAAKSQAILNPKNTITNVLRFIGRKFHDDSLQTMIKTLPFRVIEKNSQSAFVVQHQNKDLVLTPVEVIAMILGRARRDAEKYIGGQDKIGGAVITVPVYFNMDQYQAIRDAALIAKLNLLRLISAPTLACLDYVISTKAEGIRNVLLIDIGAGFLNVGLFEIEEGLVEVKAVAGNPFLGGEDFNSRLTNYLASTSKRISRLQRDNDTRALSRVRHACEKAKCELSSVHQTRIELEHLHQGEDLIWPINRSRFEEECISLFRNSTMPIERVLEDSGLEKSNVKEVVIVGGSSRIPKLVSLWSEFFNHLKLVRSLNPDEAVARGAGFQAAVLTGGQSSKLTSEMLLMDVAPFTIGIETPRGMVTPIVKKNTLIPTKISSTFSTFQDNQESFLINIYEGERPQTRDNKFLGEFSIHLSPAPRGVPEIAVTLDLDANMRANFYAVERLSGKNGKLTLPSRDAIPKEELWKMIQSAEKFDEADTIEELRIQAKNNLEENIFTRLASYNSQPASDQTAEGTRLAELHLRWLEDNPGAQESEYATRLVRFMQTLLDLDDRKKHERAQNNISTVSQTSTNKSSPSPSVVPEAGRESSVQLAETDEKRPYVTERQLNEDQTADELSSDSRNLTEKTSVNLSSHDGGNSESSNANVTLSTSDMVDTASPRYFNGPDTILDDISTSSETPVRVAKSHGQHVAVDIEGSISRHESPLSIDMLNFSEITRPGNPAQSESSFTELFSQSNNSTMTYTDQDFLRISTYLRNAGRATWSNIPRIYTVLRLIDQLDLIDVFIDQGITDIWFPFNPTSLPTKLSPTIRARFVERQSVVLSKSLLFEKSSDRPHVHFPQGEILPFQVVAKLGTGAHAHVDKVMSIVSHREYARKLFRRQRGVSKDAIKSFLTELQVLKRVQHYHCIELVQSYTDPKYFALLMTPVAECNLSDYYELARDSPDKVSLLRSFLGCLASGLQYIHSIKIRHRDIKPQNILVCGDRVILSDFGIALDWEHLSRSTTTADSGKTFVYAAPEVVRFEKRNSAADIWSLGCVFMEIVTVVKGETIASMRNFFKERSGNYRFYSNIENLPLWARRLRNICAPKDDVIISWVRGMLEKSGDDRPTAAELYAEIVSECRTHSVPYCGTCCLDPVESSEMEDDEEDDLWDRAAELTIAADGIR